MSQPTKAFLQIQPALATHHICDTCYSVRIRPFTLSLTDGLQTIVPLNLSRFLLPTFLFQTFSILVSVFLPLVFLSPLPRRIIKQANKQASNIHYSTAENRSPREARTNPRPCLQVFMKGSASPPAAVLIRCDRDQKASKKRKEDNKKESIGV